jgi:hypothetical protein
MRAQWCRNVDNDKCSHSLALLFDPLILLLEVRHGGGVPRLFLREGLNIMLKLFDRDVRVGSSLLLRLDDLIQLAQLRIEPRQRRTLFLQPALRLGLLRLSSSFRSVVCAQSALRHAPCPSRLCLSAIEVPGAFYRFLQRRLRASLAPRRCRTPFVLY